jgi:diacylglycerol kinase family enzyme
MRALMVSNLRSGVGDPGTHEFLREIGERDIEITLRFLREGAELDPLLADADTFDRVIVAGGDGTISSALYALRGCPVPVALYPAGTANLFARNLHLPSDPAELARIVFDGTPVRLDLGELDINEGRGFFVMAGVGFDAGLIERAQPLKPILGESAYIVAALQDPLPTLAAFELELDGERVTIEGIAVVIVNLAMIQLDLSVTHNSDPRDGLFDVVVVKPRSVAGLMPTVLAALLDRIGHHEDRPGLQVYSAREVSVTTSVPLPFQADGEVLDHTGVLRARVLAGAATVMLPPGPFTAASPSADGREA